MGNHYCLGTAHSVQAHSQDVHLKLSHVLADLGLSVVWITCVSNGIEGYGVVAWRGEVPGNIVRSWHVGTVLLAGNLHQEFIHLHGMPGGGGGGGNGCRSDARNVAQRQACMHGGGGAQMGHPL